MYEKIPMTEGDKNTPHTHNDDESTYREDLWQKWTKTLDPLSLCVGRH